MSKLSADYMSKLRTSLKMVLGSSSTTGSWKHRHQKFGVNSYRLNSNVVAVNNAIKHHFIRGELERAGQLFDEMLDRTVVSWNTMITGYCKWGMLSEAMDLISQAHHSNVKFSETTFSLALSICGRAQSLVAGNQIHALVLKSRHERFKFVGSALLYLYGNCHEIENGRQVFDELHEENELLWSLMLVAYVQSNLLSEAVTFFDRMPSRGVVEWSKLISGFVDSEDGCETAMKLFLRMMSASDETVPNEFTLDCVIRACGKLSNLWGGRVVHGLIVKLGFELDGYITSSLIHFYSSCELMNDAVNVYDGITFPSVVDSNALISGLVKLGRTEKAGLIFNRMADPNPVSYNLMIKGYALCGLFEDSERLFLQMPVKILASLNTMISIYARNSQMDKAAELFEKTKGYGEPVTWNSMISGYIQNDKHEDAVKLYVTMLKSSIRRTRSTFSVLFRACTCLGSLPLGQMLHAHLEKTAFPSNAYVGTSLLHMYSKCGSIADATAVFCCISSPNVAAWTALISAHAHHGLGLDAVSFFDLMIEKGIIPNSATFVAVLSACTHAALLEEGMRLFYLMQDYGLAQTVEHFTCVVELLGRSGHLQEAEKLIEVMPVETDSVLLISLLNSCLFWMDLEVGERVAKKIVTMDSNPSSAFVIMSNMYSRSGKWGEKYKIREFSREMGIRKEPSCSWIGVNNTVHVFSVNDSTIPNCNLMECLESLTRNAFIPIRFTTFSLLV